MDERRFVQRRETCGREQRRVEPGDANGAVLCDADLAVLASPPEAYAAYASAVREEYGIPRKSIKAQAYWAA